MMSGGSYSWPAGHLLRPKSKDQEFAIPGAENTGSGPSTRSGASAISTRALWELVFHDCIVSTWYWGESSDFLLQAAPEVTRQEGRLQRPLRHDPAALGQSGGLLATHRDVFLRTCRNTCKFHEAVAGTEMLTHEFVTPDRAVQRPRDSPTVFW